MKLVSKDAAIAAIRVVPDEVKPLSGYHIPALLRGVAERYELAKSPSVEETNTTGAKFQHGRLIAKKREISISELGIYNDAIAATTTDTSDSEVVVDDLYGWLKEHFGFREPTTKPVRAFQSDLIAELDNDPDKAFKSFAPLIRLLQKEAESINGINKQVQFGRIDFGSDPSISGPTALFVVERRGGVPWISNRYFCKAYMRTEAHIRALELLDELLGSGKG